MPVGPEDYRRALRRFATGITVVTVLTPEGEHHGMTASSFAAVSLQPPLVLVSLEKTTITRSLVLRARAFAVSILAENQEAIARAFSEPGHKPFETTSHSFGKTGAPLLDGALGWVECEIWEVLEAGDHDVVIGEVIDCDARDGLPLVYFNRAYRSLGG